MWGRDRKRLSLGAETGFQLVSPNQNKSSPVESTQIKSGKKRVWTLRRPHEELGHTAPMGDTVTQRPRSLRAPPPHQHPRHPTASSGTLASKPPAPKILAPPCLPKAEPGCEGRCWAAAVRAANGNQVAGAWGSPALALGEPLTLRKRSLGTARLGGDAGEPPTLLLLPLPGSRHSVLQ